MLNEDQKTRAIEVMREYLAAKNDDGPTPVERHREIDKNRIQLIENELQPLLAKYLEGEVPLSDFKTQIDSMNKRHAYWGFKGIKGQMFFNMMVNVCEDTRDVDAELKSALPVPPNEDAARSRIKTFHSFIRRIGDDYVEGGGSKHGRPKPSSVPFFLSYFWQIQDRQTWPVYYTNSVNASTDMNLWQPSGDLAEDYITYKHLHEELAKLFAEASGQQFDMYEVEHVFWFKDGNPRGEAIPDKAKPANTESGGIVIKEKPDAGSEKKRLPESYVPPIVAALSRMALNELELVEAAKASGTNLPTAFEKHINAAFTILGYDTKLLGQGQGRVPDGRAIEHDNSYAVLWDAKVRSDGYQITTDDRIIRDYIDTQTRQLKRRRTVRNIYYAVISSHFVDNYEDAVRNLKMETDVNEVIFIEATALVEMVDTKLRDPQQITLGPDGIQRLFSASGILTAATVNETLT